MASPKTSIQCKAGPHGSEIESKALMKKALNRAIERVKSALKTFKVDKKNFGDFLTKKNYKEGGIAGVLSIFIAKLRDLVVPTWEIAEELNEMFFEATLELISDLDHMLNCRIVIPHFDSIWQKIMKQTQPMTLGVLLVLPGTAAMSILYSAFNGGQEAFDNNDVRAILKGSTPDTMLGNWMECTSCRPFQYLPVFKRERK
jgi:hypothetical protein